MKKTNGSNDYKRAIALIAMMKADGKVTAEEEKFLMTEVKNIDMAREDKLALVDNIKMKYEDLEEISLKMIATLPRGEQINNLKEIYLLAHADNKFHPKEKALYLKYLSACGFNPSKHPGILEWMKLHLKIKQKAVELFK